ncbi:MAG: acyltransferase [Suilimivivens sp.]|jgi:hypothetical protein
MFIEKIYEKVRSKIHEDPVDKLRRLGAEIGSNVHIYDGGGAIIDYDYAQLLKIGNNVTISSSTLLMHDASMKKELHYVKIGRIIIGDNVFIGSGTIILPNVKIGNNVIIGAGSVVSKDISNGMVAVGRPIRIIGTYDAYMKKCSDLVSEKPYYSEKDLIKSKECLLRNIEDFGYIGK